MASESNGSIVEFSGVSHSYGKSVALRDLSLTIAPGQIHGLLGLNGAGKTTAIRLLLSMLRLQSGAIKLFGSDQPSGWLKVCAKVGATIESPAFYPHLTGRANLELLAGLSPAGDDGISPDEALELTGLAEASRLKARKYSMGMLQRLYLAQALLGRPDLLVLDEPMSNLDPQGVLEIRLLIRRLNSERGLTVLLSSHQLAEVQELCTRVSIVHRGRLLAESDVAELFEAEQHFVHVRLDRPAEGLAIIKGLDWCSGAELEDSRIRTRVARAREGELNALLVGQGFVVSEFAPRPPTLEEFFHERIAADDA